MLSQSDGRICPDLCNEKCHSFPCKPPSHCHLFQTTPVHPTSLYRTVSMVVSVNRHLITPSTSNWCFPFRICNNTFYGSLIFTTPSPSVTKKPVMHCSPLSCYYLLLRTVLLNTLSSKHQQHSSAFRSRYCISHGYAEMYKKIWNVRVSIPTMAQTIGYKNVFVVRFINENVININS
jgi:hypothetical protein